MQIIMKAILLVLLIICFVTDVKKNKIYSWVTVPFAIVGLVLNYTYGGMFKEISSVLGGFVPIVLFAPFIIVKMFTAGDIKLFPIIGFLMGTEFVINNLIYSFIAAVIILFVTLMVRKKISKGKKISFESLRNIFLSQSVINFEKGKGKFPFATAIFLGTFLQLVINYKFIYFA